MTIINLFCYIIFIVIIFILVKIANVKQLKIIGGKQTCKQNCKQEHKHNCSHNCEHSICNIITKFTMKHKDRIVLHPLEADSYTSKINGGSKKTKKIKKWTSYKTWDDLKNNEDSLNEYLEERTKAINNPNLDWSEVLNVVNPKLKENREYIGIVNIHNNSKKLYISRLEASPTVTNSLDSDTIFANIPEELVSEMCEIPGLFIFHTHPADIRGSPLPSSHDLLTAINLGAVSRYAGSVVISRYGVLVHGLDWNSYKAINSARDWEAVLLNYSFDVISAHESIRSWSNYNLDDYLKFYPRYRMFMFVYPSYEMVGENRKFDFLWNLESPIDNKLIDDLNKEIFIHNSKKNKKFHINHNKLLDLNTLKKYT